MKHTNLQCALSEGIQSRLNQQIVIEHNTSAQYLAMASWAVSQGYQNSGDFLYKQAEEERKHMLKIIDYINDAGGHVITPNSIAMRDSAFKTLKEVFIAALEYEMHTSKAIHRLVDYCLTHKEFATFGFLQWFLTEQIEEGATARSNLALFDMDSQGNTPLYIIDQSIGRKTKTASNNN